MTSLVSVPPRHDETEISLFGPGVGECIVAHVGANQWIVIDSCLDPATREPAALGYLKLIGVAPQAVSHLVITHFHDDHISGATKVLAWASNAELVVSAALNRTELLEALGGSLASREPTGLGELASLFWTFAQRGSGRVSSRSPRWTKAIDCLVNKPDIDVLALSPSDAALMLVFREIVQAKPTAGKPRRRVVAPGPNVRSVALWVRSGQNRVLLGADLETTTDPNLGWDALLASTSLPPGRASLFKVAHHGSEGAHHDGVWAQLLDEGPKAILAPYSRSHLPLPRDVERLKARAGALFCTASALGRKSPRRDNAVERIVSHLGSVRLANRGLGHVRLRAPMSGVSGWTVELFGEAFQA